MTKEASKYLTRELKKLSESSEYNINKLRVQLALDRILARIVTNPGLACKLIFKGGLVLAKVYGSRRYTRDIDALGQDIDYDWLRKEVVATLEKDIRDGFWFGDIQVEDLEHQGKYEGLRFDMAFQIGEPKPTKLHKLARIHLDIGVGDVVSENIKPTLLEPLIQVGAPVSWKVYPPEFIYSEKLETLVSRGSENSRAKDYHDLLLLFPIIQMDKLREAINLTFSNRGTEKPDSFVGFLDTLEFNNIRPSWTAQKLGDFEAGIDKMRANFTELDSQTQ